MKNITVLISESLSEGHPDKVADQISDAVVDAYLEIDHFASVACETLIALDSVVLVGEVVSTITIPFQQMEDLVRGVLKDVGYEGSPIGINPQSFDFQDYLYWRPRQLESEEGYEADIHSCQQAIAFGYATDETHEKMPLPIQLAHQLMHRHAMARITGALSWLGPRAKAQVAVRYENGVPTKVEKVALSTQCTAKISKTLISEAVTETIIKPVISEPWGNGDIEYLVISSGVRVGKGSYRLPPGVSGRAVVSDTYGGSCPQGSGFLSGKDPAQLDRCAAYAARHVAKNIVAARLARRCTVQLAFAADRPRPVVLNLDFHGTGNVPENVTMAAITRVFNLSPSGIVSSLQLRRPIFRRTSLFGHFGREENFFTWENTDKAEVLRDLVAVALSSHDCPSIFVSL